MKPPETLVRMPLRSRISPTSGRPCGGVAARRDPAPEPREPRSTEVADPASGGGEGTSKDRKWLATAIFGLLGAIVTVVGTIIVAEINRQSPGPVPPNPTHSPTPDPSVTPSVSLSPSPSPTVSMSPSPSPTTTTPTSTLAPAIDPYAYYLIENAGTGSCLSWAWGFSTSAGPSPCADRAATDGFRYYMPQPDGTFELLNKVGGDCLGEQSVQGGVPAVASCNEARGQQWRRGYANAQGASFVNVESRLCLAATGPGDSGTIELESCDQQPNELWQNNGTF